MLNRINGVMVLLALVLAFFVAGCNDDAEETHCEGGQCHRWSVTPSVKPVSPVVVGATQAENAISQGKVSAPEKITFVTSNDYGILVDVDSYNIKNPDTGVITDIKPEMIKSGHWKDGQPFNVNIMSRDATVKKDTDVKIEPSNKNTNVKIGSSNGTVLTTPTVFRVQGKYSDGTVLPDGHIILNGCRTCWKVRD